MLWTEQEHSYMLNRIGNAKVSTIAKNLGRSERAIRYRVGNTQQLVIRQEGMGVSDFVKEFGVNDKSVVNWIERGHLKASTRVVEKQRVYVFSYDDVTDFLRDYGYALSPVIRPTHPIWRDIVSEIRAELKTMLISARDMVDALHLVKPNLALMRRKHGFPSPYFCLGSRAGGNWYKREDVAVWLRSHPRYITQAAVEEFRLTEDDRLEAYTRKIFGIMKEVYNDQ